MLLNRIIQGIIPVMRLVLIIPFLLISCATFNKEKLSGDLAKDLSSFCVVGSGKGRVVYTPYKYVFSFDSAYDQDHANWLLSFNIPFRPDEFIEFDWSEAGQSKLRSSFEESLLTQKNIDPKAVEIFLNALEMFMSDISQARTKGEKSFYYDWRYKDSSQLLFAYKDYVQGSLENYTQSQGFGLVRILVQWKSEKISFDLKYSSCNRS